MAASPVAFAQARLNEDEEAAEAVDQEPQRPVIGDTEPRPVRWYSMRAWFAPEDGYPAPYEDKARTALADRYDPARALREVEVGRRILERHGGKHWCPTGPQDDEWKVFEGGGEIARIYPCADMLDLLCRWDSHPDYDPAWKPAAHR